MKTAGKEVPQSLHLNHSRRRILNDFITPNKSSSLERMGNRNVHQMLHEHNGPSRDIVANKNSNVYGTYDAPVMKVGPNYERQNIDMHRSIAKINHGPVPGLNDYKLYNSNTQVMQNGRPGVSPNYFKS